MRGSHLKSGESSSVGGPVYDVVTQSADISATQPSPVRDYSADMHTHR